MVSGDEAVLDMVERFFNQHPFIFVSCSLTHAPMEFVQDMLAFQQALGDICETNSWSVDATKRPDENESEELCRSIFSHDSGGVRRADAVIAELSYPSTGSGIELGIASERGIPILLVAPVGKRVSPFVRGMPNALYREYTHPNELIDLVRTDLIPRIRRP
ncbi:MAG TPA: nucleoside 2-deoxyribosyltransferase [bacterium]|nr:nucleoside 2-deoxyribosyltransferase [bacterium]